MIVEFEKNKKYIDFIKDFLIKDDFVNERASQD